MAEDGTWPSIQRMGLLSTAALVDLYQPPEATRTTVLDAIRRQSVSLTHATLGSVVVRDQGPLKFIDRCLLPGVSVQDFLDALNGRVFFWVTAQRLERLLRARLYKARPHLVLQVDTASLVSQYGDSIALAAYNTGSVHVPGLPARGPATFVSISDYPYADWARRRGASGEPLVELTVPWSVPDIARHVVRVDRRMGPATLELIFEA
jgi:hypothetical protein